MWCWSGGGLSAPGFAVVLGVFVVLSFGFSFASLGLRFGAVCVSGSWSFVSLRSGRVLSGGALRSCFSSLRRRGVSVAPFLRPPVGGVPGVVPASPSCSGSVLLLSSPSFVSAVLGGACPVSLSLACFRWPLRSAVVGSLCVAGRCGVFSRVPRSVLAGVLASCCLSLGFRLPVSGGLWGRLASVWGGGVPPLPAWVGCPVVFSVPAVVRGLVAVGRCCSWVARRGGCPPAVRPLVACLCGWLVRALR